MNKNELARASKLEAEAKAIRRAEKAFWADVESRLDEVKERFHLSDISGNKPEGSAASSFDASTSEGYRGLGV